jgi:hypothetical protein
MRGRCKSLWEIEGTLVKARSRSVGLHVHPRGCSRRRTGQRSGVDGCVKSCGARAPSCDDNGGRVLDCRQDTGLKKEVEHTGKNPAVAVGKEGCGRWPEHPVGIHHVPCQKSGARSSRVSDALLQGAVVKVVGFERVTLAAYKIRRGKEC